MAFTADGPVFAQRYLARLLDADAAGAEEVLTHARWSGLTSVDVYAAVVAPALRAVGRAWEHRELSVADEHMATEITLAALQRLLPVPAERTAGPSAVVACPPGERHTLGARGMRQALLEAGWDVAFLGADTPVPALMALTAARRPDLVVLSVKLATNLEEVSVAVRRLKAGPEAPLVLVGGAATRDCGSDLGADRVDDDLHGALGWLSGIRA